MDEAPARHRVGLRDFDAGGVALQSLAEGKSVQRTAEALGYESVSSFISMFRKTLGSPPARYLRSTHTSALAERSA